MFNGKCVKQCDLCSTLSLIAYHFNMEAVVAEDRQILPILYVVWAVSSTAVDKNPVAQKSPVTSQAPVRRDSPKVLLNCANISTDVRF